jgi:hypothetical protein
LVQGKLSKQATGITFDNMIISVVTAVKASDLKYCSLFLGALRLRRYQCNRRSGFKFTVFWCGTEREQSFIVLLILWHVCLKPVETAVAENGSANNGHC